MAFYRVVRAIARGFPVAAMWLYISAFVLALALMFVFPPGTLLLLGMGLVSLVGVILLAHLLSGVARRLARRALSRGVCPSCGARMAEEHDPSRDWQCPDCDMLYRPGGEEVPASARARRARLPSRRVDIA